MLRYKLSVPEPARDAILAASLAVSAEEMRRRQLMKEANFNDLLARLGVHEAVERTTFTIENPSDVNMVSWCSRAIHSFTDALRDGATFDSRDGTRTPSMHFEWIEGGERPNQRYASAWVSLVYKNGEMTITMEDVRWVEGPLQTPPAPVGSFEP
jgi:hypothetical protein